MQKIYIIIFMIKAMPKKTLKDPTSRQTKEQSTGEPSTTKTVKR